MKVGDRDRNPSIKKAKDSTTVSRPREAERTTPPTTSQPRESRPADRVTSRRRTTAESLDRDPDSTTSDAAASREVTGRQSRAAATVTGTSGQESLFDRLSTEESDPAIHTLRADGAREGEISAETASAEETGSTTAASLVGDPDAPDEVVDATTQVGDDDPVDHLIDDPIEEEQHTDLTAPPGFEPGSATPNFPNFENQQPSSSRPLPLGGTEETFVQNGVTYTRSTRPDGTVSTSYSNDGIDYSSTNYEDGRNSTSLSASGDNGSYSRTVETNAQGQVQNDTSFATDAATDPETGEITLQSRQDRIGPNGERTTTEEVVRPDGGRANTTRTQQPDGSFVETYNYEGEDTTINRSTVGAVDGSSQTTRERSYTSDQSLEELVDAPAIPDHADNVVPLPEDGRSPTQIHDVVVTTTNPSGQSQTEYEETTVSQSSSDVQVQGTGVYDEHTIIDTLPRGIVPDPAGTSVTHSVSTVSSRNPETGELDTTTGATQTLTVAGQRHPDVPPVEGSDGSVSVTRVDSWNSAGESASSYSSQGLTRSELIDQAESQADDGTETSNGVRVGDNYMAAGPPSTGKSVYDHLNMKGGGEAEDWLGAGSDDIVDLNVSVARDAEGDEIQENITYSTVDDEGNGRTVTRSSADGTVAWVYTDLSNGGQDYQRQTVFEGSKLSVYEERTQTGPDTFTSMSETTDDGVVIASTSASRQEASEADLQGMVNDGELTQAQLDRLLADGPPYYLSRALDNTETLYDDDGNLREDADGNPLQPGHHVSSYEVENGDGYSVSEHYRIDYGATPSDYTDSRLSAVTDPTGNPPYRANIENRENGQVTDSGAVEVDTQGRLTYDNGSGEEPVELGQYNLEGTDIASLITDGEGFDPLSALSPAVRGAQLVPSAEAGRLRLSGDDARLQGLAYATDAFGVYSGARGLWDGIADGDARQIVEGAGAIAGGVESVAAATSALASRVGAGNISHYAGEVSALTKAGRLGSSLGKVLGAAGGFIQAAFGVYDLFNAESGHDRAAAGLNVAAGAVAVGSAFFGPPGWVVGGLISGGLSIAAFLVGGGDDNVTVGIDDRLE